MITKRIPVFRIFLIAALAIALAALIFLADRRKNAADDLSSYFNNLNDQHQTGYLLDSCIQKSSSVESLFRLYTIRKDKVSKDNYLKKLEELSSLLSRLEEDSVSQEKSSASLSALLKNKNHLASSFLRLKQVNDSLLRNAVVINEAQHLSPASAKISLKQARIFVKKTDSIVTAPIPKQEKGLVKRLKDAIANKEELSKNKVDTKTSIELYTDQERKVQKELNSLLSQTINKLAKNQNRLDTQETALVLANHQLLQELSSILKGIGRNQEILISDERERLEKKAKSSYYNFDRLSLWTIGLGFFLMSLILFNIWKQYLYERELISAKKEAEKQVKIRKDFLAHMSHEIRTPLNAILGFSEQLELSKLTDEQQQQSNAIRESSQMLLAVVNDILDLSKLEAGNLNLQLAPFSPKKTVKNVVSSLKVLAEVKELDLIFNCDFDGKLRLVGDEFRLKQVLVNLINNAIKFTSKGSVTVNAYIINQTTLKVDVIDTGRGIPKSNIDNVFDEFNQVHGAGDTQRHNGTGLGLAICKKIITAQKGSIKLKSEMGRGSVFSIEIPFQPAEFKVDAEVVKKQIDTDLFINKKLLIAEDNKMNIMLINTIFKKWGVKFDVAENGLEAFNLHMKNNYDLILTDIHMPELDGIKLTQRIRSLRDKQKSLVPIIAITANVIKSDLDIYMNCGINDYIIKPFLEEPLFEKIAEYI